MLEKWNLDYSLHYQVYLLAKLQKQTYKQASLKNTIYNFLCQLAFYLPTGQAAKIEKPTKMILGWTVYRLLLFQKETILKNTKQK